MVARNFFLVASALALLSCPRLVAGQEAAVGSTETLEARVIEVLDERVLERENGTEAVQQDLLLEIVSGEESGRKVEYRGISDLDVVSAQEYQVGDCVVVQKEIGPEGEENFVITDFVRRRSLYLLGAVFVAAIAAVGGRKGLRSLLALAVSFVVIVKAMLPAILSGLDPLAVGLAGSLTVMALIIYLTEGWNRKSHVAIASVSVSLSVTLILSVVFTAATRLSGMAQEETMFLIDAARSVINFRGLLLAGILIGTTGVLDDIIVSQVEAVEQIKSANPRLSGRQVFSAAYKVGKVHFGAVINTLFLTYAGASLPLLLLFSVHQEPFVSFGEVINNEVVATEIVRALIGSLGLAVAMPVATLLACRFLPARSAKPDNFRP